jgi:hypothetical protein
VIDHSLELTTQICHLIQAGNRDKQANSMMITLRAERYDLWKRIEKLEHQPEIYKKQDTAPFERIADDPFSLPLSKGYDRPPYRVHCHRPEASPLYINFEFA